MEMGKRSLGFRSEYAPIWPIFSAWNGNDARLTPSSVRLCREPNANGMCGRPVNYNLLRLTRQLPAHECVCLQVYTVESGSSIPTDRCEASGITDEYSVADHPLSGGSHAGSRRRSCPDDPRLRIAESTMLHSGDVSDRA